MEVAPGEFARTRGFDLTFFGRDPRRVEERLSLTSAPAGLDEEGCAHVGPRVRRVYTVCKHNTHRTACFRMRMLEPVSYLLGVDLLVSEAVQY